MKRYFSMLFVLLLCVLMLHGCKQPSPSTPGSTPQAALPTTAPTTTAPTEPTKPNPLITVYLLTGCTSSDGEEVSLAYDEAGRLLELAVDGQVMVAYTYGAQGNVLSYRNTPEGIDQTYDARGNILTDRTEDGVVSNTYDDAGRCIQIQHHSADGKLLSVTLYTYDEQGNLLSEVFEVDGTVDHEILHTYNENGWHLTQTYCRDGVISAEGPSYVWEYEPLLGLLTSERIYYGEDWYQSSLYSYDKKGKLDESERYHNDGTYFWYKYFYDKEGQLINCAEGVLDAERNSYLNFYAYQFDSHGHLIMVKYDYDVQDKRTDRTVCWTYDESGLLLIACSVASADANYAYQFTYDDNFRKLTEVRTGDDPHEITWVYDGKGQVSAMVRTGTAPQETAYVYDEWGNLIQRSDTVESITTVTNYTYTAIRVTPEVAAQLRAQQEKLFQLLNGEQSPSIEQLDK